MYTVKVLDFDCVCAAAMTQMVKTEMTERIYAEQQELQVLWLSSAHLLIDLPFTVHSLLLLEEKQHP